MEERSKVFRDRAKNNANNSNGWTFSCIIRYIQHQKERAERKEITARTVKNYFQVIKLFCEMSDFSSMEEDKKRPSKKQEVCTNN